ncbi:hypothetical protein [Brunnivagina elsteri]|uniref:hypothetical protein n=1 Tax=Brunnivagina elsteri TaxID=1247191 RepID=UPI00130443B6|nr:hypothetical protein [Calothrix elsteri]
MLAKYDFNLFDFPIICITFKTTLNLEIVTIATLNAGKAWQCRYGEYFLTID